MAVRDDPSQRDVLVLGQLEKRRDENDRAMWLAPVITMAAQAFLLQVLSDRSIPCGARLAVLLAGVMSTLAACWTVFRAHSREVLYSEAIRTHSEALDLVDVRPRSLPLDLTQEGGEWRKLDHWVIRAAHNDRWPSPYLGWALALMLFVIADVAVFCAV